MKKNNILQVRMSEEEIKKLDEYAARCNMSRSELVRSVLSNCDDQLANNVLRQELFRELSPMMNDINTICSLLGKDHPELCGNIKERMMKLWRC